MANCEKCGRGFQISYKVDIIAPYPDWDVTIEPKLDKIEIEAYHNPRYTFLCG